MKKILLILFILLLPTVSSAKNLSDLKIRLVSGLKDDCKYTGKKVSGGYEINGCYWPTQNIIYINSNLSSESFNYVLLHEFGHWITEGEDINLFNNDWELVADWFAFWAMGMKSSPEKNDFFKALMGKLNI